MPAHQRYSSLQLQQYFDRVRLPEAARVYDVSALEHDAQLSFLKLLTKHQLVNIPFENLTLHYSWHRVISTDAHHVFDKIVKQPGRGGYCMENNTLFHVVLASLRFDVYLVGSRVHESIDIGYGGMTHCLNIITIGNLRYTVDVGYGGNGPVRPYVLEDGLTQEHIAPAQIRYRRGQLPGTTREAGRVWIYEQQQRPDAEWNPMYCFVDMEILPADVRVMNLGPSSSRTSIFQKLILCVRFTTDSQVDEAKQLKHEEPNTREQQIDGEINGVLIAAGSNFKWRYKGNTEMEKEMSSERERLDIFESYYRIHLDAKDQAAIKDTATAIMDRRP